MMVLFLQQPNQSKFKNRSIFNFKQCDIHNQSEVKYTSCCSNLEQAQGPKNHPAVNNSYGLN